MVYRKEASEIMRPQLNNRFSTRFQQIFAAGCVLIAEICILLFFRNSASKSRQILIEDKTPNFRKSKPNPAKKLFLSRYSDTRIYFVLNIVRQTDKLFQTFTPSCRDADLSRPLAVADLYTAESLALTLVPICGRISL
jgi:hypothetical protein